MLWTIKDDSYYLRTIWSLTKVSREKRCLKEIIGLLFWVSSQIEVLLCHQFVSNSIMNSSLTFFLIPGYYGFLYVTMIWKPDHSSKVDSSFGSEYFIFHCCMCSCPVSLVNSLLLFFNIIDDFPITIEKWYMLPASRALFDWFRDLSSCHIYTYTYMWCVYVLFFSSENWGFLTVGKRRRKSERNIKQSTECLTCLGLLVTLHSLCKIFYPWIGHLTWLGMYDYAGLIKSEVWREDSYFEYIYYIPLYLHVE